MVIGDDDITAISLNSIDLLACIGAIVDRDADTEAAILDRLHRSFGEGVAISSLGDERLCIGANQGE